MERVGSGLVDTRFNEFRSWLAGFWGVDRPWFLITSDRNYLQYPSLN